MLEVVVGFILGMFVMWVSRQDEHGPNSNVVMKKIYKHNGKYYRYVPEVCICPL